MAMNNTYNRQVAAQPANLNPNQPYVAQYDAMAELTKQMADFGEQALKEYAKADYAAVQADAKQEFERRELQRKKEKAEIELNQNPRAREKLYKRAMEKIDREFGRNIDDRCKKEWNSWVALADADALTDLRIKATRDLQEQNNESMFDRITQAAKRTVGANEAYSKMIDAGVKNDLDAALAAGAITRLQHDKAWRNYNESKLYEGINHKMLVDPQGLEADLANNVYGLDQKTLDAYRVQNANALKTMKLKEDLNTKAKDEAIAIEALRRVNNREEIPLNTLNALPLKVQAAMQERSRYTMQGQEVPTDAVVYDHLRTMFTQNPDYFKNINIYEYAGDLSMDDLTAFKQLQDEIVVDKKGKASVNPEIKRAADLMAMAYKKAGIDKNKAEDAEKRYHFNSAYTAEVEDFIAVHGRKPTRAEDEAIVNNLTKETVLKSDHWYTYAADKQAWTLEAEDYRKAVVDYDDIDAATVQKIKRFLNSQNIPLSELTTNEQKDWIERVAGTFGLPQAVQNVAMRERLKEIREYISDKGAKK